MRNLALLALVVMTACGADPDMAPGPDMTPEEALPLIHSAASIPKSLLTEVVDAGAAVSPKTLSTLPLSMLLLSVGVGETGDLRRLWKEDDGRPIPEEMWVPVEPDRLTLLPRESISDVEIKTQGDLAEGSFRFRRERMMEGRVEFTAERTKESWQIVEFRLPAAGASTRLQEDGAWKLSED